MDTEKLLEIIRITIPVFALLGLGNILSRTGTMTEAHRSFLNWLVYYISLPCLIFVGMAVQPIGSLMRIDFIFGTLISMLAVFLLFAILSAILRVERKLAVVMIFGAYWSNVAYMGFPLAESAFGSQGFLFAAVVNAVSMPILVALTYLMIGLFASDAQQRSGGLATSLRGAFINPIILASIGGLAYSWIAGAARLNGQLTLTLPTAVNEALAICEITLKDVGKMGLSLALIAVGGKIRFRSLGKNVLPLSLTIAGKLIIMPLSTLIIMRALYPNAEKNTVGVAVLLMATPSALASTVVAAKFKLNEEFLSSVLAVSTLGSIIMIPIWLYVVL